MPPDDPVRRLESSPIALYLLSDGLKEPLGQLETVARSGMGGTQNQVHIGQDACHEPEHPEASEAKNDERKRLECEHRLGAEPRPCYGSSRTPSNVLPIPGRDAKERSD